MGKLARSIRSRSWPEIRREPLSTEERRFLHQKARYEGSPYHKRNPGDFGLVPPANPRPDKTLCDEAHVTSKARAVELMQAAIDSGLVSKGDGATGFPKHLWVVTEDEQVFEARYGGSSKGCYHGYPVRRNDPFREVIPRHHRKARP